MRLVKLGIISVVGLFLVIFLLSLLLPSSMRVSRAITINAPVDSVLKYIGDLRQWPYWNAFVSKEKLNNGIFSDTSFSSSEIKISIKKPVQPGRIETSWQRTGQDALNSEIGFLQTDRGIIVQWYFDFTVKWYPWEKFGSIVFDKELGPPMENSLEQLKKITEKSN